MPKKTLNNSKIKPSKQKSMNKLADASIFTPTARQRQIKATFWSRFEPGPFFGDIDKLSLPAIQEVVKATQLKDWWNKDGFKEWFLNKEEGREKLEYLFLKALDTADAILDDPDAQASAKVNLIKVIGELANKFPNKWQEKFADEDINKMTDNQLKTYLERQGFVLNEEKVIDVSGTDEKK